MKFYNYIMGEESKVGETEYFFQNNGGKFSLYKFGIDTPLLTDIINFSILEEDGLFYVALRTSDEMYSIYNLSSKSNLPERVVSVYPGRKNVVLPNYFCIELFLGESSKRICFLEGLKLALELPKESRTVELKGSNYENRDVKLVIGRDEAFSAITIAEGKKNTRYRIA